MPGVIYALNGRPLHEGHSGWRTLRDGTQTQGGITNSLVKVPSPGRPGYRPAPSTYTEQIMVLVVRTPRDRLEELLALCDAATVISRVGDSTKEAAIEIASAIPSSNAVYDAVFDVTITVVIYEGAWRDVDAVTVGPTSVTTPTQAFTMLDDIGAPVFDMDVFIRGVFDEFTLTDSGGSWLKTTREFTPQASDRGLLYVGATKKAFLAMESSPWVPVSDASQYIDVSANGGFRLTPELVSGNPANRRVALSLVTLAQTSTTLRVRAKRRYRMN